MTQIAPMTKEQRESVQSVRAAYGKRRAMVHYGKPELCGAALVQSQGESWLVFRDGRVART